MTICSRGGTYGPSALWRVFIPPSLLNLLLSLLLPLYLLPLPNTPTTSIKNSLLNHLDVWKAHASEWMTKIVEHGAPLLFHKRPPRKISTRRSKPSEVLDLWVEEALAKGYIEPTTLADVQVVSPIFAVEKSSGGHRIVIDLRYVNEFQVVPRFKMEQISMVPALTSDSAAWATRLDLKDGFHHLTILPEHRPYLAFKVRDKLYRYVVKMFGSSASPYLWYKTTKTVLKLIREEGIVKGWNTRVHLSQAARADLSDLAGRISCAKLWIGTENAEADLLSRRLPPSRWILLCKN